MIPAVLHSGSFGGYQFTDLNRRCEASWRRLLPSWPIVMWGDSDIDSPWFREACVKRPINAHNYFLLWSIWKHGGVSVDNDVEVIRQFDLDHQMFIGFQKTIERVDALNNAVIGAVAGHPVLRRCLDRMELRRPYDDPVWLGPGLLTAELYSMGMQGVNVEQQVADVMVYDTERFYPFQPNERRQGWRKVTDRTFSCHHWQGSWI